MNRIIFLILSLFVLIFATACHHNDKTKIGKSFCPTVYNDITWNSYGNFNLNDEGSDDTAWRIVDECGWHIFNNHTGGYGDTLQVASENEEVMFIWAYNDFYGFSVTNGWQGQTSKGIRMGDHVTLFADAYPYFRFLSGTLAVYQGRSTRVYAYFDNNGFLEKIYVGYYLRM